MKRIKLAGPMIKTREQAVDFAREIAVLIVGKRAIEAEMDRELIRVRQVFEKAVADRSKEVEEKATVLETWAEANPDEFGKAKSVDLVHAVVGWRTGQPALKTAKGWTWKKVLQKMRSVAGYEGFIRVKEEVDKEGIIAAREQLLAGDLLQMGVRIVQAEAFFVEPKISDNEAKVTVGKEAA